MSLVMIGLTPVPLVRALFCFVLNILLDMLMAWGVGFVPTGVDSKCDVFSFVVFVTMGVKSKGG